MVGLLVEAQQVELQEQHLLLVKVLLVARHLVVDTPRGAEALEALEVLHRAKTLQAAVE
jgi:hypothetical protein